MLQGEVTQLKQNLDELNTQKQQYEEQLKQLKQELSDEKQKLDKQKGFGASLQVSIN